MADDESVEARIERLETALGEIQAAIGDLATLLPKATGPTAGLPGRIADALAGIDERLAAVERMGREQFELDQRLTALDETMTSLTGPMEALAPHLKDLGELAAWLGRIEERLHVLTQRADADDSLPVTVAALMDGISVLLDSATETTTRLARLEQSSAGSPASDPRIDAVLERLDALQQRDEDRLRTERALERIVDGLDRIRGVAGGRRWGRKES